MATIMTLADRKSARISAIRAALPAFEKELQAYAHAHQGRFILFGSAVTGRLHYESDVDLLADFPHDQIGAALDFAEQAGERFDLDIDALAYHQCKPEFLDRILPDARVIA